jgi:predicted transposase YbfD/YdcC
LQHAQAVSNAGKPIMTETSVTRGRNRSETRTITVFEPAWDTGETEWEPLVKQIIQVNRNVLQRSAKTGLWSSSAEAAYYLTNVPLIAPELAAIRRHWHVENKLHYTRDVTFLEDQSRIRTNPGIFARLRSFAYNIIRCNKTDSFNQTRYAAALGNLDGLRKWILS